jgi:hypothetical protein
MTDETRHRWPDEAGDRGAHRPAPGRLRERIVRALGDLFLTAGMGRGLGGGRSQDDVRSATNVILLKEGDVIGRDANGDSGGGRD